MKTLSLLIAVGVAASGHAGELTGQIFIVTESHDSEKLGLVAVAVFEQQALMHSIDVVRAKLQPEIDRLEQMTPRLQKFAAAALQSFLINSREYSKRRVPYELYAAALDMSKDANQLVIDAVKYRSYLQSASRYFKELPSPVATTKTDADGNFTLTVPETADLVVGAATTRAIFGSKVESYHWLVHVPNKFPAKIMLSNDNLVSVDGSILFGAGDDEGMELGSADVLQERLKAITQKGQERLNKMLPKFSPEMRAKIKKSLAEQQSP